jgi:hypothetical protein
MFVYLFIYASPIVRPIKSFNRSESMAFPTGIEEHVLDPILISPDQFLDCAQAIIHTILFQRSIDVPATPESFYLPGLDISYASAESCESTQQILTRLGPLQDSVFTGIPRTWVILSVAYSVPKQGWFKSSYQNETWERWCLRFSFDTRTVQEMRVAVLHTITQITMNASGAAVPALPEGALFSYTMNLPTDKDWETSKEFVRLVNRIVNTPATMVC